MAAPCPSPWPPAVAASTSLDDVGAHPASLALMPFLRLEVVKLDLRLVQARPGPEVAEIMFAAALVSRDRDPSTPSATSDLDRSSDHVLTHDRALVLEVARSLVARTLPAEEPDEPDEPDEPGDAEEVTGSLVSSVGVASVPDA